MNTPLPSQEATAETIEQSTAAWIAWCERRGMDGVANYIAVLDALRTPVDQQTERALPPLPASQIYVECWMGTTALLQSANQRYFTAEQMQAYARAACSAGSNPATDAEAVPRQEIERDAARLDWLESMANKKGGLLLHDGSEGGRTGLGLRPNYLVRTLREAIDAAAGIAKGGTT